MKLTLPQQDVYFEQLLYPNEPIYNIGAKIEIKGIISFETLNRAYIALIDQHDAYRCVVSGDLGSPGFDIVNKHNSKLGFIDFSNNPNNAYELANTYMENTFKEVFAFNENELLHKFILIKVEDDFHYLFSMYHHIITDGWGTSLMFQRLVKNYNEILDYEVIKTEYPYGYTNFVNNDLEYQNSNSFSQDKEYWMNKFENIPDRMFNKLDEKKQINKSKRKELIIKRSKYDQLIEIGKENKSSTFHVILAIIYLYFARKHQNNDFAIGLPVLNRSTRFFKETVGLFMGVSPFRFQVNFDDTFEDLIQNIKLQLRQDYRHQRFPLGKLIQELNLFDQKDRLFDISLSYEKQNYADHFKNTKTSVIPLTHQSERIALAIYIREFDISEDVKIDFDYNINYFDETTITQVVSHFKQLIGTICSNVKCKLSEYTYLTNNEKLVLSLFNETNKGYKNEETFLSLFYDTVKQNPLKPAIKDNTHVYSYRELNLLSNKVASYIDKHLACNNSDPIAVLMDRSANLIVTLLGILKSGHAYIPLDPTFPSERLEYIMSHSGVKYVIGTNDLNNTTNSDVKFTAFETLINVQDELEINEPKLIESSSTAYIIYTSGSTGNPKGVAIGHRSLLNFLLSMKEKPGITDQDLLFSVTTQSFDISVLEFFTPLISGATVYIADKEMLSNPLVIIEKLKEIRPSVIQGTPSFYQMLFNAGWLGEKELKVFCGGDLLSESLTDKLITSCSEVWNMYGPTETTIWSSVKRIMAPKDASNIGSPINNTQFYILDECMHLMPIGSSGAIYIGGDGLAKGYFKNKTLTDKKFITNPFNKKERIYETGDLGKWNNEGEIEFLGRNDHQVKIRGYRIELDEIETRINEIKAVKSSVVVSKKGQDQEAFLIAYIIPNGKNFDQVAIKKSLLEKLPSYMVPDVMIQVKSFPLTPNQKVDRKSLTLQNIDSSKIKSIYNKPTTELETNLCRYFKEVLEFEGNISINDNFFELGGHSLNAVKLINIIKKYLHQRISLKTIFDNPTVESLTIYLELNKNQKQREIDIVSKRSYYPITKPQYAIWLAGIHSEKSIAYNMFMAYSIEGELDKNILEKAFIKVIDKYEALRTSFVEFEGFPHQKINPGDEAFFEVDQVFIEDTKIQEELENYVNEEFDLQSQVLLRAGLFQKIKGNNILVFVTHHIIMDGWSLEILIKEVVSHYKALIVGESIKEEKLPFQFKDYVVWQQEIELESKDVNHQFWEQYLSGYQWKNLIPYDQESLDKKNQGTFYHFNWNSEFLKKLNETTLKQNTTLHTLLVTAFNVLIYKMQNVEDICLGTINSGRSLLELHPQIGMFVKTLPLRLRVRPDQSFTELLHKVQDDLLAIDIHQDIPEDIFSTLRLEAILVLQNPTFNYEKIPINQDLTLKSHPVNPNYNRLPLLINFSVNEDFIHGSIHFDTSKYEKETIEILVLKYQKILEQIIDNRDITIDEIDADLAFEKEKKIEIDFNF